MNAVAQIKPTGGQMVTAEQAEAIRTALKTSLYPGATDESVDMVLAYCRAGALDPMTKPVHIVPMWVPEKKQGNRLISPAGMRDVIMPGIELYRTKAHRTGEYAGQDEATFGPTIEETLGGVRVRYPEWCSVAVYRLVAGSPVRYSAKAYWLESYATQKRDSDAPNAMWKKRPFGQLEKCAEALALRKAFPEAVGAQPTAEEMEGRVLEGEATSVRQEQAPKQIATELAAYPADKFAENLPAWGELIKAGKRTASQIINMVKTKGSLTEEQMIAIEAFDQAEDVADETSETGADADAGPIDWDAPGEGEKA
ncbi:recombinase [Xanthomonas arboricola]|uniref:Phage recombination protein Bet n=1 Tax=Xanthomonas campestris pv. juglandis TaxID=195709 RepID=A0A7U7HLV7_XANCJ|nr:phage recombination protein Bet [Xanthomonas arboricola]KOA98608.1 recombinase [Xanthomonas arboricola]KOB16858.1 recombinase [Xanthomonas arboricola]KOB25226.1 recombinase [Xanthomonas arboricola]KOB35690.1 recombinase [Xanthomonas arboricola]KOB45384.1 recombinase [Xanthomonas arboricola]